jgi:ribosomal protein S18 acetylase RimI-like enzyme
LEITIRYASAEDAEIIADLSRQTFSETFGFLNTKENMNKFMTEQFSREMLINEVSEPDNIFILVMSDETPVGYAKMITNSTLPELGNKGAIEISRIYVLNSSLGAGIGPELMRKCVFIAKEMKCEIIWLGVWKKNPRAIAFYTKWGFEKFAEHPFKLGDDVQTDWVMKKELL